MIPRNLCNPNPATPSEKSFITPGQQMVSRTVGNDQNFQQSKRRRNQFPASIVDLSEKPLKQRNELGMFFDRSEEHTSELQSRLHLVCRLLLEKKNNIRPPRLLCSISYVSL